MGRRNAKGDARNRVVEKERGRTAEKGGLVVETERTRVHNRRGKGTRGCGGWEAERRCPREVLY